MRTVMIFWYSQRPYFSSFLLAAAFLCKFTPKNTLLAVNCLFFCSFYCALLTKYLRGKWEAKNTEHVKCQKTVNLLAKVKSLVQGVGQVTRSLVTEVEKRQPPEGDNTYLHVSLGTSSSYWPRSLPQGFYVLPMMTSSFRNMQNQ